jgi:two-component system cell cycle response regulator
VTANPIILIVDDEPHGQKTLESLLIGRGYQLIFASEGQEAYTQALTHMPDLILLDVMMPVMDGYEVCRRLRANPAVAEVPVLMITALDDMASRLQGLEAGADDFITKPFNRSELRTRVQTIVRLNRYRRLFERNAQLNWVIESAEDGYIHLDPNDQINYTNPQARLYLNVEGQADAPVTTNFLALVRQQYQCVPEEAWQNWPLLPENHTANQRYLVQPETAESSAFWLEVSVLNLPGQIDARQGCLVRLRNVTVAITNQMDMRNFYSAVSHKLRTPLIYVINGLELLAEFSEEVVHPRFAQLLEITLQGGRQLHRSVNDVLDYGQVGALIRQGDNFNLSQLPGMVARIQQSLAIDDLTLHLPEALHRGKVGLPPRGMEILLWELLENARKFHPAQTPHIDIRVSPITPGNLLFQFSDNGGHLTAEQLANAWMPYFQGEKNFTGQVPGMGLGLSTVASLVWSVGGKVRLYNQSQGAGIVVELTLPEV